MKRLRHTILIAGLIVTIIACGCRSRVKEEKPEEVIVSQLGNLDSLNKLIAASPAVKEQRSYDSAVAAIAGESTHPLRQLYYSVHDFYGYLADVQRRFYIFCGDKNGKAFPAQKVTKDTRLTNAFFAQKGPNDKYVLFLQLMDLIDVMERESQSQVAREAVARFKSATTGKFHSPAAFFSAYFADTSPVAAIMTFISLEQNVKEIETIIINQNLNN